MNAQPLPWFPGDAKGVEPEREMTFAASMNSLVMKSVADISEPLTMTGLTQCISTIAGSAITDTIRAYNFTGTVKQFVGFAKTVAAFLDPTTGDPVLPKGALGHILLPGQSYHMSVKGALSLLFRSVDDANLLIEHGYVAAQCGAGYLPYFRMALMVAHIDVAQSWDPDSNSYYVNVNDISTVATGRHAFMTAPSWSTGNARIGLVPTLSTFGSDNISGHSIPLDLDIIISPPADQGPLAYFITAIESSTLIQDVFTRRGALGMPYSRWSFAYGGSIELVPSTGLVPALVGTGPLLGDSTAQNAGREVEASTGVALAPELTPMSAPSRTLAGAPPSLRSLLLPKPLYHPQ